MKDPFRNGYLRHTHGLKFPLRTIAWSLLIACCSVPAFAASRPNPGLHDIGGEDQLADAAAMNSDGNVVVGYVWAVPYTHAARWTLDGGVQDLGTIGDAASYATAVNADGSVVVGTMMNEDDSKHAFRWQEGAGMQDIGTLGGDDTEASAVNAGGNVVVGQSSNLLGDRHAFRWVQGAAMQDLGTLGGTSSFANSVNASGEVVVGQSDVTDSTAHAFRWTNDTGMTDLGTLGGNQSSANSVDAAGDVVVGGAETAANVQHAYRWTQGGGMQDLGTLGGQTSTANGVSTGGDVVVGDSETNGLLGDQGFRWSAATGMQSVEDWLASNGFNSGDLHTSSANSVSADGQVITGMLQNNDPYIATGGRGIIDAKQVNQSLAAMQQPFELQRQQLEQLALGSDCASFGPEGVCVQVSGGLRVRNDNAGSYHDPAATVALGYRLSPSWRIAGSVSYGALDIHGQYGSEIKQQAPAFTLAAGHGDASGLGWQSYAALGVIKGNVDLTRGYMNGATEEHGQGTSNTSDWTVAARVGYGMQNGAKAKWMPYLSLRTSQSRWSAYQEQDNVNFPASFQARQSQVSTLGLGLDANWDFADVWQLEVDAGIDQELQRNEDRSVASVLNYVYSDTDLMQAPGKTKPYLRTTLRYALGKNQQVALSGGWRSVGDGSGEGSLEIAYRHMF